MFLFHFIEVNIGAKTKRLFIVIGGVGKIKETTSNEK